MGDDAPDSVTVSDVAITVAALSFHQWNVSFGPLAESMFRRMKCVKGDVRVGERTTGRGQFCVPQNVLQKSM